MERILQIDEYALGFRKWAKRYLGRDPQTVINEGISLARLAADKTIIKQAETVCRKKAKAKDKAKNKVKDNLKDMSATKPVTKTKATLKTHAIHRGENDSTLQRSDNAGASGARSQPTKLKRGYGSNTRISTMSCIKPIASYSSET
jgi:hypothetical protein